LYNGGTQPCFVVDIVRGINPKLERGGAKTLPKAKWTHNHALRWVGLLCRAHTVTTTKKRRIFRRRDTITAVSKKPCPRTGWRGRIHSTLPSSLQIKGSIVFGCEFRRREAAVIECRNRFEIDQFIGCSRPLYMRYD
jgi:hypothetical protein